MVEDKVNCLTTDHQILTSTGWKYYNDIRKDDEIATLKDGNLVYEKALNTMYYPQFNGEMYNIKNVNIDLRVSETHRMWVSTVHTKKKVWSDYKFMKAEDLQGKHIKYLKNANWPAPDYQFILPGIPSRKVDDRIVDMDAWITFFGIWMAEGWARMDFKNFGYCTTICQCKERVKAVIFDALNVLGYKYSTHLDKINISDYQLAYYMKPLSVGAPNKTLPNWVWKLSQDQCQKLVYAMQLGDGHFNKLTNASNYYTSSLKLADDFQKLVIHAGWASNLSKYIDAGNVSHIRGDTVVSNYDIQRISVMKHKTKPAVNHAHASKQDVQEESMQHYEGPVFCLQVPSGVFMVRRNGKAVWTGSA